MDSKAILAREYCTKFDNKLLWIIKFAGFFRFQTKNGRITPKKASESILRAILAIISGNFSAFYMYYICYLKSNFLSIAEVIILTLFALLQNIILLNIAIPNRNSGLILLDYCFDIDILFGVLETKFMRDIVDKAYLIVTIFIASFQGVTVVVLIFAYPTPFSIHVVGTVYFGLLFFIFYDVCFLLTLYVFLALRVHYINVAIIKRANLNSEHFPKQFLFDGLIWKKKFDDLVTFHNFASSDDFVEGFKIIFKILRQLEKCYRFTVRLFC